MFDIVVELNLLIIRRLNTQTYTKEKKASKNVKNRKF